MTSAEYNVKTSQILQKLQFKLEKYFTPKFQTQNDQKTKNFRQIMSKCQKLKSYHKSAIEQNEDWLAQFRKKQFKQNQKKLRMNKNIQQQPSSACQQKLAFILQQHKKQQFQVQQMIVYQKNKQHEKEKSHESAKRKSNSPVKQQKDSSQLILQKLQYLQSRIDKLQFNKSKTSHLASSNSKNNKVKFNKNKSQTQKKTSTNKSKRIDFNNSKQKSGRNSNRKVKTQQAIRSSISVLNNNSELKHFQNNISPKPKLKKVGTYYKKIQTKKGEIKKKVNNKETPNGESQVKSIFSLLPKVRSAQYL